jgi:NitT/TauT family transport system ATP-binding protein
MISLRQVGFSYSGRQDVRVLSDVSFDAADGEFVTIIGESGSGKSTLLRLVGGLIEPSEGSISIGGLTPDEARQQRMFSFVFQRPALLPWRTVSENVKLPLEITGQNGRTVDDVLSAVGLQKYEQFRPSELSGGMQQRVALARALMLQPRVLLMDEPFAALDEITRDTMLMELLRIRAEFNLSVLFVTHSIAEAVLLSDRVLVLGGHPATISNVHEITLGERRTPELRVSPAFERCVSAVRSSFRTLGVARAS